jgi:flagella basal body P-ring formation protein FlgA
MLGVVVQLTVVGGGITQTSNASAMSKGRLGNLK